MHLVIIKYLLVADGWLDGVHQVLVEDLLMDDGELVCFQIVSVMVDWFLAPKCLRCCCDNAGCSIWWQDFWRYAGRTIFKGFFTLQFVK